MSELSEAINEMRNMREAYDQIGAAAEAYNTGKAELAANIAAKGVPASASETLPELAEKVSAIAQESYTIDGGEMYAKQLFGSLTTPNYWNLYEVLAQLLSDGRLVNYGGILLAEYYKGYDSLALSGAGAGGAYVVSDKDGDGNFIMYTEDTTHTWSTEFDGKGNRWVAYCFAEEGHEFEISDTEKSPRSIHIGRHVGSIINLTASRCAEIVVTDGNKLDNINTGSYTQAWIKKVVLRNLQSQSGAVFYNNSYTESVYIQGESVSGRIISNDSAIRSIIVDFKNANADILGRNNNGMYAVTDITIAHMSGAISIVRYSDGGKLNSLKQISIVNAKSLHCYFDSFGEWNANPVLYITQTASYEKTESIVLGQIYGTRWGVISSVIVSDGWCKQLNIALCTALTEADMYAHILQRLKQDEPDCGDGVTITLGSTNLAKLTSEESVQLLDDLTNIYGYTFA